tara:strand:+ start:236 stop:424 length:189 start_codon:yes stop_codon:yes gene_type:complete
MLILIFNIIKIYMCFCNRKCDWCDKRKPNTQKFKGWNKYTGMIICDDCFDKKWGNKQYKLIK